MYTICILYKAWVRRITLISKEPRWRWDFYSAFRESRKSNYTFLFMKKETSPHSFIIKLSFSTRWWFMPSWRVTMRGVHQKAKKKSFLGSWKAKFELGLSQKTSLGFHFYHYTVYMFELVVQLHIPAESVANSWFLRSAGVSSVREYWLKILANLEQSGWQKYPREITNK